MTPARRIALPALLWLLILASMLHRSLRLEALFWTVWVLAAAGFVALAWWARGNYYLPGDRAITFGIQDLYTRSWADDFFTYANRAGDRWIFGLVLGSLAAACLSRRLYRETAIVAGAALSQLTAIAVGVVVHRPDLEYRTMRASFDGLLHPRIYPNPDGFPSGHVHAEVIAFGLVILFVPRLLPWRWLSLAVQSAAAATIVAGFAAPMYSGAHWFSDCLGAALLGILTLALAWRVDVFAHRHQALVRVEDLIDRHAAASPTVVQTGRPLRMQ